MRLAGVVFMVLSWLAIISLAVFCFTMIFSRKKLD